MKTVMKITVSWDFFRESDKTLPLSSDCYDSQMRLRQLVLPLYVLLLLDSTLSEALSLTKFKDYHQGRLEFGAGFDYMSSTSNFDSSSAIRNLTSGASYQIIKTPLGLRYGYGEKWNLSSELMISTSQSKNVDATRNNSSIPEIHIGADALLSSGGIFNTIGEVGLIFPLENIKMSQDSSLNTEGVPQVIGLLGIENRKNKFIWYGQSGFNYRMEGRSGLLLYQLGAGMKLNRFSFGGEVGGFHSVMDDSDKGSAETKRNAFIQRVNGGSNSFYSVNPAVAEFRLWSEHDLAGRIKLGFKIAYPFYGLSYSNGLTLGTVLSIAFDLTETQKAIHRLSVPINEGARLSTDQKVEDFNEEVEDGVDQEMFQPPPPPPRPVRLKRSEPIPSSRDVRTQLDDTEMSIQLKAAAKKKKKKRK